MFEFIKKVLFFSAILFVVVVGIECLLLFQTNIFSYKRMYVETHLNDIKILLLGNSHIEQGLDPIMIGDSTFNMAIQGRGKIYDMELAKRYLPQMGNLKIVIMPLDYFDFSFGREKIIHLETRKRDEDNVSTYKCMYYKYMGIHVDQWWYWSELINSRLNYMARFFKTAEDARECDSLGYVSLEIGKRRQGWKYERLPDILDISKEIDKTMYTQLFCYYETIARIAYDNAIRLILITTPTYKTYQQMMNDSVRFEMWRFYIRLKNKYPTVDYYDFSQSGDFHETDFYDASHLNEYGAVKFSKMVSEIVKE